MNNHHYSILRAGLVPVFLLSVILSALGLPQPAQAGIVTGLSEYYIPAEADQLWAIFVDNDNNPVLVASNGIHYVVGVTASTDNTTVYYDHWEDGYDFDSATLTNADESFTANKGTVLSFESPNVPIPRASTPGMNACAGSTHPGGTTNFCYDGRDRIYIVGGIATVTLALWPQSIGTVYAFAWELFPTKPYQTGYIIPVGEDLFGAPYNYDDFDNVYVVVQSTTDGNRVQIDDPRTGAGNDVDVVLNKGQVTQLWHVYSGTTITADAPVQAQFIVGQAHTGASSESRGYTIVPSSLWSNRYYAPVGGSVGNGTDLYLYNPNSTSITISWADSNGTGTITLPAGATRAYSDAAPNGAGHGVPDGSAVELIGSDVFWGIGSVDREDVNYDWNFSLIPFSALTTEYYIGWAPGTSDATPTNNCSPIWVTATQDNTVIQVDYSPVDGTYDLTATINRQESYRIYDPDNNNTGLHIVTSAPIAAAWGESDVNQSGSACSVSTPNMDLGYTVLPLLESFIDVVLDVNKIASPSVITNAAGQTVTFTISVDTGNYGVNALYVEDSLPANWEYIPGTTTVTYDGAAISTADPTGAPGPDLTWNINASVDANKILTVEFDAITTAAPGPASVNEGSATGTYNGQTFTATDSTTVRTSALSLNKDSDSGGDDDGNVSPGDMIEYTIDIGNAGGIRQNNIVVTDSLPTGTSYVANSTQVIGWVLTTSTETYLDTFNPASYSNTDQGSTTWPGSWDETGDNDSPASGTISINNNQLRFNNVDDDTIERPVDLSNATAATLMLDWTRVAGDESIRVELWNGTGWDNVGNTNTGGAGSGTITHTLTAAQMSASGVIRFVSDTGGWSNGEVVDIDNVQFEFQAASTIAATKDNDPADTNDLDSGVPATLVTVADGFVLDPGQTMTITYQVTADDPTSETEVVNVVSVSSDEEPTPITDTATDNIPQNAVISDFVWNDLNFDGIQDPDGVDDILGNADDEVGLSDVTVNLLDSSGNPIDSDPVTPGIQPATITTDGSGNYSFTVPAGSYIVEFVLPSGYAYSPLDQGGDDALDNDADTATGRTADIAVVAGETNTDVDAGMYQVGSLVILKDAVPDNPQDFAYTASGVGLSPFTLDDDAGADATYTNTQTFNNLAAGGTYSITETMVTGWILTDISCTGAASSTVTIGASGGFDAGDTDVIVQLAAGETVTCTFENKQLGSISGQVRLDTDNDGDPADGDSGITTVTVSLYTDPNGDGNPADGALITSTATNGTGDYTFTDVTPGDYVVVETNPAGHTSTYDLDGTTNNTLDQIEVTLSAGGNSSGNDFLDANVGSISGQVRLDTDNDGDPADGDSGITTVTVSLYTDPNGDGDPVDGILVTSTTTNGTGNYTFTNVTPGDYVVVETDPAGYTSTYDSDAANDNFVGIMLTAGASSVGNDFLDTILYTISGQIRYDTDNDGDLGDGDSGLAGADVALFTDPNGDGDPADGTQVGATITTTGTGNYIFSNLTPGNYVVVETNPTGYSSTADSSAPNDDRLPVVITNADSTGNVFLDTILYSISGQIRNDIDNDGDLGDGESGLAGADVALYTDPNGNGDPADGIQVGVTITTTGTGNYTFNNLIPGNYVVVETNPAGYASTADSSAPNDDRAPLVITNANSMGNDFLDTNVSSISGQVRLDIDNDGDPADGDSGITTVTISLYTDPNGDGDPADGALVTSTTTNGTGNYTFSNVTPGDYVVVETNPAGYASTYDLDGTTNNTLDQIEVTLAAGGNSTDNDFLDAQLGSIGDRIWNDTNGDGVQDVGENGIPGITVYVDIDNSGTLNAGDLSDFTDANGTYSIVNVPPGTYNVIVNNPPAGYNATYDLDGGNDNVTSVTLSAGQTLDTVDFGYQPQNPGIQVTKSLTAVTYDTPQLIRMTYSILVENAGNVPLGNIQVTDDLATTFAPAASFSIVSMLSSTFTTNPNYDGGTGINMLGGTDSLGVGANGTITLVVLVDTGGNPDIYTNTADAQGTPPSGPDVQDSDSVPGPSFIDPAVTKAVNPSQAAVGDVVTFTITVVNNGNVGATGVVVTDVLPDVLDYVNATSIDTATSLDRGTITLIPPRTVQVDLGNLAVTDVIEITVVTQVNSQGLPPIQNVVTVAADPPPVGVSPDPTQNNSSTVDLQIPAPPGGGGGLGGVSSLPDTGFAPGKITYLPNQPAGQAYAELGDLWLEIPNLGVKTYIVGVPRSGESWDVDWLWEQAGWLQGSAFPTWQGNSVVTGHVYLPNGGPGPFVDLSKLRWGDQIIVHAFGQRHVYEVRTNHIVMPDDLSVFKHEQKAWLTLLTCKGYDESSDTYKYRIETRAVLIKVEPERY